MMKMMRMKVTMTKKKNTTNTMNIISRETTVPLATESLAEHPSTPINFQTIHPTNVHGFKV